MLAEEFQAFLKRLTCAFAALDGAEQGFVGPPTFGYWVDQAQSTLTPEQYALLLEALPSPPRKAVFESLSADNQKSIFLAMQEESRRTLIKELDSKNTNDLLDTFDAQALLELAEELPDRFIHNAYARLDDVEKERFERAAKYSGELAGHWINFEAPTVYGNLKVSSAERLLKRVNTTLIDFLFVQDKQGHLVGEVALSALISAAPDTQLKAIMTPSENIVHAASSMNDASDQVVSSGRIALPVVDEENQLLGRIVLTTAYEHRNDVAEQQISMAGGLTEDEDLFAPVWRSSRNRAVWLGINLLTAFLASWCIGLFEATLQQVVALAILMPVVASMGGISGSQTLTVIVRALALGKITDANRKMILHKELRVGIVNGVLWAFIIGVCVHQWFNDTLLGLTIALAILVNIVVAVVSGVLIPALLDRLKIDPALSGSVILTTVTDVVGFVVFLGTGALILT